MSGFVEFSTRKLSFEKDLKIIFSILGLKCHLVHDFLQEPFILKQITHIIIHVILSGVLIGRETITSLQITAYE